MVSNECSNAKHKSNITTSGYGCSPVNHNEEEYVEAGPTAGGAAALTPVSYRQKGPLSETILKIIGLRGLNCRKSLKGLKKSERYKGVQARTQDF